MDEVDSQSWGIQLGGEHLAGVVPTPDRLDKELPVRDTGFAVEDGVGSLRR